MPFDLTAHVDAMSRSVRNLERDGKPAKAVVASCVYDTDVADLWDAVTNPDRLRRWFSPVTGELRLGGRFHVENNASGTITACEPQRKVEGTWEFAGAISWITITLAPDANGARLELEHVAFIDPHWDRFGPGAVGVGWDLGFMGLARHLAEPTANLPQEAVAGWHELPEAKAFIRTASDGWGAAAISAGESRERALTAAEATRQFYTGEAPPPEM
jgi:uncharacterized protein YndB with AHSA1/START domain